MLHQPALPLLWVLLLAACAGDQNHSGEAQPSAFMADAAAEATARAAARAAADESTERAAAKAEYAAERAQMVREQIAARGVTSATVLEAMRAVPRHRFVPAGYRDLAYADHPLPIGHAQTISQPYVVAFMTEALGLAGPARVLEVGTGSGYQAAVLAELGCEVYTIEIVEPLAESARAALASLGYDRVYVRAGDGYRGWPEHAPFDAIVVTAAPDHVPQPLVDQLKVGGRMIIPVGDLFQDLVVLEKTEDGLERRAVLPVRFVPMTGEAQKR